MPLPERVVEPIHVSRGTVPDADQCSLPNELEAVTNGTLANAIRQLSSLSRHAEDLFGELAKEAHTIASRASSLQARLDKLAIKTTQLDSTVEEVSLQEMHMRKAFKSAVMFDQQVVSRDTMPSAMLETYNQCDKPPPLSKLNSYREDGKDGMKFYTDPDYFFHLWRQEMLKDTERMMLDRGKKPHKPRSADSSGGRHKKRVRQPYNTRERQKQMAVHHGEYIMSNSESHYASPPLQQGEYEDDGYNTTLSIERPSRPNSIELRRNYSQHVVDSGIVYSPISRRYSPTDMYYSRGNYNQLPDESLYERNPQHIAQNHQSPPYMHHYQQQQPQSQMPHQVMSPTSSHGMMSPNSLNNEAFSPNGTPTRSKIRPSQPPPAPPSASNSNSSTPSACNTPTRGRSVSLGRETLPPPPPPPVETPVTNIPPPPALPPPPTQLPVSSPPSAGNIPPPPPPPPPLPHTVMSNGPSKQIVANGDIGKSAQMKPAVTTTTSPNKLSSPPKQNSTESNAIKPKPAMGMGIPNGLQYDPRSDLLKAIRDGIKLRKVEKIEQKEGERAVNALHDVASILARRVAVEISESESGSDDSEYDSEGWAEQETPAVH